MSQMGAVSDAFVQALSGSFRYVATVDVWASGELVAQNLDVTAGSISVSADQKIRTRVRLTVADPDGLIRPTGYDSTISPYGPELVIRAGLDLGGIIETVPLGTFPIVGVDVDQMWRTYRSADDVIVTPSGTVTIEAVDRMQWVAEATFEAREQPKRSTVLAEIGRLLSGVAPWQPPALTDRSIPTSVSYDNDRLGAVAMLADVLAADPVTNPAGAVTLLPRGQTDPVWRIAGGEDGVLTSWQRSLSRDGVYNAAVVYGADPENGMAPKVGRAYQDDGPLRYRQGLRVVYTQSSPILTKQVQVDAAAVTTLARAVSQQTQTVDVECSPNPAIECGDWVTLQAPRGDVDVQVQSMTLPLTPGRMQLSCTADPVVLGRVA